MTVKEYYYRNFDNLAPDKQFHFATRMKNYLGESSFDGFLREHQPNNDLADLLQNNDYSKVNRIELRKPYFEKYEDLYGVEATLFRIHHLLKEYNTDTRATFCELYGQKRLYKLVDDLLEDKDAIEVLSTWAVNVICLTEELFPRGQNVVAQLAEWALGLANSSDPTLVVYLHTHIILCESEFYTKRITNSKNLELLKKLLAKSAEIITDTIDTISLDAALEFLVCCKMAGVHYARLEQWIDEICREYKKDSPYLINYRRDKTPGSYYHTLDGAEHINALYIMSGLDN